MTTWLPCHPAETREFVPVGVAVPRPRRGALIERQDDTGRVCERRGLAWVDSRPWGRKQIGRFPSLPPIGQHNADGFLNRLPVCAQLTVPAPNTVRHDHTTRIRDSHDATDLTQTAHHGRVIGASAPTTSVSHELSTDPDRQRRP